MQFPNYDDTKELVVLSHAIYKYRGLNSCTDVTPEPILPPNVRCHMYERDSQDTQVMVLSHPAKRYVAVVYAGTDDLRNALTDADIVVKPFGPRSANGTYALMPPDYPAARVHAGFDNAVFHDGLFDRILAQVRSVLEEGKSVRYRLLTTGHSLGAADSILTSVALTHYFADRPIMNVNFGCPRTGNEAWREYVNSIPSLAIWRFVNGIDIIPRLPTLYFFHVGHTVQMSQLDAKAYYLHDGDAELGFAGVPTGWGTIPFVIVPFNGYAHMIGNYEEYIVDKAGPNRTMFYVSKFETIHDNSDDDDASVFGDDFFPGPPEQIHYVLK